MIGNKIELAENYLGRGYTLECLLEFYQQIIWFLTEKLGYIECKIDYNISYMVEDGAGDRKIEITKSEKQIKILN